MFKITNAGVSDEPQVYDNFRSVITQLETVMLISYRWIPLSKHLQMTWLKDPYTTVIGGLPSGSNAEVWCFICVSIHSYWTCSRVACDLRHHRAHMTSLLCEMRAIQRVLRMTIRKPRNVTTCHLHPVWNNILKKWVIKAMFPKGNIVWHEVLVSIPLHCNTSQYAASHTISA